MERLILARHAETDWNVRKLVNGVPATPVPLSARGRDESRRLGVELADEAIDVCVVTPFPRTRETALLALDGREVPLVVVDELRDPYYGDFEGGALEEYRDWARSRRSSEQPPGGGEARATIVARYVAGFRRVLELPQRSVLAVLHSLPVAYALAARDGRTPEPRTELVQNAHPYPFARDELERVVRLLEQWCAAPSW